MRITVDIKDNKASFFLELINNLSFVKSAVAEEETSKTQNLENINKGLEEVKLFKKGKLKTSEAKSFINGL